MSNVSETPVEELREWQTRELSHDLTADDEQIVQAFSGPSAPLQIDQLKTGLRVHAMSWVGVVRLENVELRIVPKLVGGQLGVLTMLDYSGGHRAIRRMDGLRSLAADGANLVDLIGWLLADECEGLLRAGLLQGYVTRDDSLIALRGQLLVVEQARRHFGWVTPLECRFDELETDVLENRWLAAALQVARRICGHPEVRRRTSLLHGVLREACDPDQFQPSDLLTFEYHRRNEHYRAGHFWARLLLESGGVSDLFSSGRAKSFVFLIDMNKVFEDFVTQLLIENYRGTDVHVRAQVRESSLIWNESTGKRYMSVIPDVVVEREGMRTTRRVPLDAKYKLYDRGKVDPGDLYQTLLYAQAYGEEPAEAFLLYPSRSAVEGGVPIAFRDQTGKRRARVRVWPLPVEQLLQQLAASELPRLPARFRADINQALSDVNNKSIDFAVTKKALIV